MSGARPAVRVRVPATSANLGPGFDALGLALTLHEQVSLRRLPASATRPQIAVHGMAAGRLRPDEHLLAYRAALAVYAALHRPPPPLALDLDTGIPTSRGLGSSSAAIVGGLVAANELEGAPLSQQALLELASALEGHPDNVAAALLGGLVISVRRARGEGGEGRLIAKRLEPPRDLVAVVCIPEQAMSTKQARGILPQTLDREDAVYNLSRTALLVAAFVTGDWGLLRDAMDDRLHQPARGQVYPALRPTIQAALEAGAHGAALSGAGSTIIALATDRQEEIARAMRTAAAAHGYPSRSAALQLSSAGAEVV